MSQELTIADARKMERSKDFHMPVRYDQALVALKECRKLDEAKIFLNSAEALAVWARVYRKDEVGRQAKQLRLHAHRRMGELARKLAPGRVKRGGGKEPGPVAKLKEYGLSHHQADAANHLAKMKKKDFNKVVNQTPTPAPTSVTRRFRQPGNTSTWEKLRQSQRNPFCCGGFIERTSPGVLARKLNKGEVEHARKLATELTEWLDAFDQALPPKNLK